VSFAVCPAQRIYDNRIDTSCGLVWGPIVQLSRNVSPPGDYSVRFAVQGDTIHCNWLGSSLRLPYTRSTDNGLTWETTRDLLIDTINHPFRASWNLFFANSERVYIFFTGSTTSQHPPIFFVYSTDRGATWSQTQTTLPSDTTGLILAGAMYGQTIAIMYPPQPITYPRIMYTNDGGQTWYKTSRTMPSTSGVLALTPYRNPYPFIVMHLAHPGDSWPGPSVEAVYHRSLDFGETWMDSTVLSTIDGIPSRPSDIQAFVDDLGKSHIWTVWRDYKYGGSFVGASVITRHSESNGLSWTPETVLTITPRGSMAKIALRNNVVAMAWTEGWVDTYQIMMRYSTDEGKQWSRVCNVTPTSRWALHPAIALTSTAVHIAWAEAIGQVNSDTFKIFYRRGTFLPSAVHEERRFPPEVQLKQNYPNPFNPKTKIGFRLQVSGFTSLKVYDIFGREVATLVNEKLQAGEHEVEWNSSELASGVYYYRLVVQSEKGEVYTETKKMVLLR